MDTSTHFSSGRNLKYKLFDNPQGCAVIRRYIKCDGAGLYHERSKVIEGMAADSFRTGLSWMFVHTATNRISRRADRHVERLGQTTQGIHKK